MLSFSSIIPVHNRSGLVVPTITSALAQRFVDNEVLVIDDGSTDGTANVLAQFGNRIRVFRQENGGPGAARNLGIEHAGGEYIAFLDSDDVWFPWTLEVYRSQIEKHDKPAIVIGKPSLFQDANELPTEFSGADSTAVNVFSDYLASGDQWRWFGVSSFVIRRDVLQQVGGFTKERVNAEDADLMLRLGTAPGFVQITNPVTFGYRRHADSAMANLDRTYAGVRHLIGSERRSQYPGGTNRSKERTRIITRHVRPVSLELLSQSQRRDAWYLFRSTLGWHFRERRWRYLASFPVLAARHWITFMRSGGMSGAAHRRDGMQMLTTTPVTPSAPILLNVPRAGCVGIQTVKPRSALAGHRLSLQYRNFKFHVREFGLRTALQIVYQRRKGRRLLALDIPQVRTKVYCRTNGSDFYALRQVLCQHGIQFPLHFEPSLIVDAGANVGYSTLRFANLWPKSRIIAIEPEAANCELFRRNCNDYQNVTLLQGAVWPTRTRLQISNPTADSWSFRIAEAAAQAGPVICAYTIEDILAIAGFPRISLLKMDIEGSEVDLLSDGADKWLDKVDALLIELHDRFRDGCRDALSRALGGREHKRLRYGDYDLIILAGEGQCAST
ncbi:MAG TPA: FkbM family methyltransferase [Pirellulales bacterium]|nr:FkbM family methyltransferase [Pirellulales bacterium]